MKFRIIAIAAMALALASGAFAASVTGSASGFSLKDACDNARADAIKQIPKDKKVTKWTQCKCGGTEANKQCTIGADS
jgi:hypothetical protein